MLFFCPANIFCSENVCLLHLLHVIKCAPDTFIKDPNRMNPDQPAPEEAV